MLYPLKLKPAFKDYLWGGNKLKTEFNKESDLDKVAESWELSCHKDGASIIENGENSGMSLQEYIDKEGGKYVLGENCEKFDQFPILIKLIDSADNLSVQVHPNDEYALRVEGEYGKTEMWYIVDCEEGASLLYGFKAEISKAEFKKHIEDNTLLEACNSVPVKKGDVFFIAAGTLHAIGEGIVIAEIQQNSNTTYRVYDYGRVGNDGQPRPLHIEKALDVTNLNRPAAEGQASPEINFFHGYTLKQLACCEYFKVYHIAVQDEVSLCAGADSFHALLVLEGELELCSEMEMLTLGKGDTVFVPAGMGDYNIIGQGEYIMAKL